jgi:two-component system LytT family response regulator
MTSATLVLKAIVVDDEPLARQKLRQLLEGHAHVRWIGEAADGLRAVRVIEELRPDVVFLDIRLPGLSGLDVLRRIRHAPAVIFTTAFDQFAVNAFELAAVDYLLKPFGRTRFLAAIDRVHALLSAPGRAGIFGRLRQVSEPKYLDRLFVRDRDTVRPLRASTVQHFEANDDTAFVYAAGARYRLNMSLTDLEGRLDPAVFLRVHRRFLVNLDHVQSFTPIPGSRFEVRLKDGTLLPASRQRSKFVRARGIGARSLA